MEKKRKIKVVLVGHSYRELHIMEVRERKTIVCIVITPKSIGNEELG